MANFRYESATGSYDHFASNTFNHRNPMLRLHKYKRKQTASEVMGERYTALFSRLQNSDYSATLLPGGLSV